MNLSTCGTYVQRRKAAYKNRPVLSLAFTLCNLFSFFQGIEFVEGK